MFYNVSWVIHGNNDFGSGDKDPAAVGAALAGDYDDNVVVVLDDEDDADDDDDDDSNDDNDHNDVDDYNGDDNDYFH